MHGTALPQNMPEHVAHRGSLHYTTPYMLTVRIHYCCSVHPYECPNPTRHAVMLPAVPFLSPAALSSQDVPGELAIAYPQLYNETRCQTARWGHKCKYVKGRKWPGNRSPADVNGCNIAPYSKSAERLLRVTAVN